MNALISQIEYYVPQNILTNEQLENEFPEWNAEKIEKKTGIRERHIVGNDETALDFFVQELVAFASDKQEDKTDLKKDDGIPPVNPDKDTTPNSMKELAAALNADMRKEK